MLSDRGAAARDRERGLGPRRSGAAASRRLLVVGDSVGDAAVAAPVPALRRATVGFFDPRNPWATRDKFEAAFDAILPADADFGWLVDALADVPLAGREGS